MNFVSFKTQYLADIEAQKLLLTTRIDHQSYFEHEINRFGVKPRITKRKTPISLTYSNMELERRIKCTI